MPTRQLPFRPNLAQLKLQAAELRRAHRQGQPAAAARIQAHHPRNTNQSLDAILQSPFTVADSQLVLAREYGFKDWAELKHKLQMVARIGAFAPHPHFDEALAAFDAGDIDRLRALLTAHPDLVHARTNLDPQHGYFAGATLLHHVAGNPGRENPLPENVVELAQLLLERGADANAETLGNNGGPTMGLLVTSYQASHRGFTAALMDVLLAHGATLDLTSSDVLDASLANHAPMAAEKMIAMGARADVFAAAALGRMDLLRAMFDAEGNLKDVPKRRGKRISARDAIGLAALYAYVREQPEALDFLLEHDGNWNMTGVNNGALLHRATFAGDLDMVKGLVAKGADLSNRDNPFGATPYSWADENNQAAVMEWMRTNCALDLHDAVSFDLPEHVIARLDEDPAAVNRQIDHWDIPQSTALHWAAWQNRVEFARLLLERGADPNIIAGNGMTALDLALHNQSAETAQLLTGHGAKKAREL